MRKGTSRAVWGYIAITVTVFVWAGFALSARATSGSALSVADVALIRSSVPALIFLPFLPSRILMIRHLSLRNGAMISIGAGAPLFFLAALGGAQTSASHVAALIAGTVPVSVALIVWLRTGQLPTITKASALAVILLGVGLLILGSGDLASGSLVGVGLLLLASMFFGAYTLGLRGSGLDPIGCTLVLSIPSVLVLMPLMASGILTSNFGAFSFSEALPFILTQGVGVGVVASMSYATAVTFLGPEKSAAIGSLAPGLAAILALPVLGETLSIASVFAILTICAGVMLSNCERPLSVAELSWRPYMRFILTPKRWFKSCDVPPRLD